MADTIGDVFGRGYQTGRGIGSDFSQMRFGRRAEKIRQQYEELAKQHDGVLPPDAVAQMEADLEDAYTQTGGRKRGVTGESGQTLSQGALGDMRGRAQRLGYATAGRRAIEGDIAGAYTAAGDTELAQGNFAGGLEGRMSGQVVRDSTAAIGGGPQIGTDAQGKPIHDIDRPGLYGSLANTALSYGKPESAMALSKGGETSRYDVLSALGGRMQILATQPHSEARYNQMKGLWANVQQWQPEFAHLNIEPGEDMITVFEGEGENAKAVDSFTYDKLPELLETVMADPRSVVQNIMESRRGEAAHQRKRGEDRQDKVTETYLDIVKDLSGKQFTAAADAVAAGKAAADAGWKPVGTPAEDGTQMVQAKIGDQVVMLKMHMDSGVDAEGQTLPGFRFTDEDGNEVDQRNLVGVEEALIPYMQAVAAVRAAGQEEAFQTAVQRLSAVDGSGIRSSAPQGATGGDRYMQLRDAVEKAESNNNPDAVSSEGAVGRMQTMPATLAKPGYGITPARDNSDAERTRVGNEYLQAMLDEFGDERVALAAYNWGPGAVEKALAKHGGDVDAMLASAPAETRNYVAKVLGFAGVAPATQTAQATPAAASTGIPSEMTAGRASVSRVPLPGVAAVDPAELEAARAELAAWDAEIAKLPGGGARSRFGAAATSREGIPVGNRGDRGLEKRLLQKREQVARRVAMLQRAAARQAGIAQRTADLSAGSQQFDEIAARVLAGQGSAGGP